MYKQRPDTGFRKYMYVNYMICKAFNNTYKLLLIKIFRQFYVFMNRIKNCLIGHVIQIRVTKH